MGRGKELAKNTIILSIGYFLPKFTFLITLPIITGHLTKSEYGHYDLLTTLSALILPIITLQIQTAAFRFLIDCRNDETETKRIISNIYLFVIPINLIGFVILFFIMTDYPLPTRMLILLYIWSDTIISITLQVVRGLAYNKLYSATSALRAFSNMILIVITVLLIRMGLNGVLLSYIVATFLGITLLVYKSGLIRRLDIGLYSAAVIKKMLAYSIPMLPNTLSVWVLSVSDRFVLNRFMGIEAVAVYSAANKIPLSFSAILSSFILAWQENASITVNDADADNYYSAVFDKVFCMLLGMMALLIGATPILFLILIRGDYSEAYRQMPLLFLGTFFAGVSSFLGGIYVAHKKTRSVGATTMLAAVINLGVNLAMVNKFGIYAASISTFISYMFLASYRMKNIKQFQNINYHYFKMIGAILVLMAMSVIGWINQFALNVLNFVLGIIVAVAFNKDIIRKVINGLLDKVRKKNDL